ncbi:MAG: glutamate racemase [Chloroflexota bacterium]|nr:glutamate racemase [Chloroflexota bacterium]
MSNNGPIGVFDSGLGGLSVLRDMRALLPTEDILYYADNAYCPYGLRSQEQIQDRSRLITALLIDHGAKAIVVACNTASSMAITDLRRHFPSLDIIGLEPAVKPAVKLTRSGKVGVLATPRTVAGERLRWLIETHAGGVEVHTVAAAGLVELVESGILAGTAVTAVLQPLLDPMIAAGVDVIVLGCTHYPFLRGSIEAYMGAEVPVIDSGLAIARRTRYVLDSAGLLASGGGIGTLQLMTSAAAAEVEPVARLLTGQPVIVSMVPATEAVASRR